MAIKSKTRQVLIDLYSSSGGLYAYTFYGRYGLTPSEAVSFIDEFKREGVIHVDKENRISLTQEGRKQILSIINNLTPSTVSVDGFLEQFRSAKSIEINAPYLPDELFYTKYIAREADKTSQ